MVDHQNIALASVEAGMYVGCSYIIAACMRSENAAFAFTFFALGLVAMLAFSYGFELLTKYDDRV